MCAQRSEEEDEVEDDASVDGWWSFIAQSAAVLTINVKSLMKNLLEIFSI